MKKIAFIFLIAIGVTSCRDNWIDTFYYQNQSGYDLVIEEYFHTGTNDNPKIRQENTEVLDNDIYIYIRSSDPEQNEPNPYSRSFQTRIVFNNERVLIYNRENWEGVYNRNNYERKRINKHSSNFYFTFTPEMYEEAIPLEELEDPLNPEN